MKRLTFFLVAAAGVCLAQGPHGPRGGGPAEGRPAAGLDMSKLQTIAGTVSAVNIGFGMEYPTLTVGQKQIKAAPAWYLLDRGFEVTTGDPVSVVAAPSSAASDPYLYAVQITNTATNLRIVLRDPAGVPLWTGGARGGAGGPRAEGGCCDPSTAVTASGTVVQLNAGAGVQMPFLSLKTADGRVLVIRLGPERVLLDADFELKVGDALTVVYVSESCTGELVALSLRNAAGVTLVLRDGNCGPAW